MNDATEKVYKILQDIFKNVWEQQKYSEVKNGVLLTLNMAIFAFISRAYLKDLSDEILSNTLNKWAFFILMILFLIHILMLLQSYFPKDKNKEDFKYTKDKINLFFFDDIAKLNSKIYLDLLIQKYQLQDEIEKDVLLDLSNQIVKLSEITKSKYSSFKYAVYRMYGLGVGFLAYFTCLYLN